MCGWGKLDLLENLGAYLKKKKKKKESAVYTCMRSVFTNACDWLISLSWERGCDLFLKEHTASLI